MLDPFLLIMVLEALSRRMRSGYPEKLFYADDLALVGRSFVGLKGKLVAMESTRLEMNVKSKMLISSKKVGRVRKEGNFFLQLPGIPVLQLPV